MQTMEGLPRHRRSCFKRSAISFRNQSPTSSDQTSISATKTNSQDKPPKNRRFLSFLFGIKSRKERRPVSTEKFHTSLEERDVRKLIRLYCKHDNLYNARNAYYGNKEFDDDCYSDMARSIPGKSSAELRSCIEELRHLFEREYKIITSAQRSRGEVLKPSIRYYDEFLFLVPHLSKDLGESHAKSGVSLLNPKSVLKSPPADLKNQLATKDLLCNKLTHFTGFPLAAFPGNISCSTKMFFRRMTRKSQKEQKQKNKLVSDAEEQLQKVTFTPSAEHRSNECPGNRKSKLSIASSYYSDEQDIKTTDLCPWRADSSPNVSECSVTKNESVESSKQQESMKSAALVNQKFNKSSFKESSETSRKAALEQQKSNKFSSKGPSETSQKAALEQLKSIKFSSEEPSETSQKAALEQQQSLKSSTKEPSGESQKAGWEQQKFSSCQDNKPSAPNSLEDRKEAPPEDKKDISLATKYRNYQQVQMLCDMIRTELTAAPDFIYFDAKWRIIEILREVHKRQLVHMKAPQQDMQRQQLNQQITQHKPNSIFPNPMPAKAGFSRICNNIKGSHCPYCCRINKS